MGTGSETKLEIGRQRILEIGKQGRAQTESETVDTNHTPRTTPKTRTTERETTRQKRMQTSRVHFKTSRSIQIQIRIQL